eukprot:Gb_18590 [translate_table: standard]
MVALVAVVIARLAVPVTLLPVGREIPDVKHAAKRLKYASFFTGKS